MIRALFNVIFCVLLPSNTAINQKSENGNSSALVIIDDGIGEQPLSVLFPKSKLFLFHHLKYGFHALHFSSSNFGSYWCAYIGRSSCNSPIQHDESIFALNQTMVNNYQQDWPFIKRSPLWDTIESLESHQTLVQRPHFSPLKVEDKDRREGLAIGCMVTLKNLVEDIYKIQLSDPLEIIEARFATLTYLATHGFNIDSMRFRLTRILHVCKLKDKLQKVGNRLEKQKLEKSTIEEEMSQLEVKRVKLNGEMLEIVDEKNRIVEELKNLQSGLDSF